MQRLLAIMVGFAFVGAGAQVSALHTHAYTDHDHAEHRHGPAAHQHPQAPALHDEERDDDAAHLESCEPGRHAVVVVTLSGPPLPRVNAFDALFAKTGSLEPLVLLSSVTTLTDVRVHGPPPASQIPARAPPSIYPA